MLKNIDFDNINGEDLNSLDKISVDPILHKLSAQIDFPVECKVMYVDSCLFPSRVYCRGD
jgi:hypothetical protein